jgi:hypothetical protein
MHDISRDEARKGHCGAGNLPRQHASSCAHAMSAQKAARMSSHSPSEESAPKQQPPEHHPCRAVGRCVRRLPTDPEYPNQIDPPELLRIHTHRVMHEWARSTCQADNHTASHPAGQGRDRKSGARIAGRWRESTRCEPNTLCAEGYEKDQQRIVDGSCTDWSCSCRRRTRTVGRTTTGY